MRFLIPLIAFSGMRYVLLLNLSGRSYSWHLTEGSPALIEKRLGQTRITDN